MNDPHIGAAIDKGLVIAAATSPIWIDYITTGAAIVIAVTGAGIGLIRLWIAIRDLRNKK